MNGYTIGWIVWGLWFAVEEGVALWRTGARGTLSYLVWTIGGTRGGLRSPASAWTWTRRAGLAAVMLWLAVHFISGGTLP